MESGTSHLNIQIATTSPDNDVKLLMATIQVEFDREIGKLIHTNQFTNITILQ